MRKRPTINYPKNPRQYQGLQWFPRSASATLCSMC